MFLLKKILTAILLPPTGPLFLAAIGLWLTRRHHRVGLSLAAFGIGALLLLSTPWAAMKLLCSLETDASPITADQLATAEAIVILGADTYFKAPEYGGKDTVGPQALERMRYGARLARASGLPIAIAGGSPVGTEPESELMRDGLAVDFGLATRWIETKSLDTEENALYLAPILKQAGIHRIALVTHAWHMPRGQLAFERQGMVVIPAPTRLAMDGGDTLFKSLPSANALWRSQLALHEWLGILAARTAALVAPQ